MNLVSRIFNSLHPAYSSGGMGNRPIAVFGSRGTVIDSAHSPIGIRPVSPIRGGSGSVHEPVAPRPVSPINGSTTYSTASPYGGAGVSGSFNHQEYPIANFVRPRE